MAAVAVVDVQLRGHTLIRLSGLSHRYRAHFRLNWLGDDGPNRFADVGGVLAGMYGDASSDELSLARPCLSDRLYAS